MSSETERSANCLTDLRKEFNGTECLPSSKPGGSSVGSKGPGSGPVPSPATIDGASSSGNGVMTSSSSDVQEDSQSEVLKTSDLSIESSLADGDEASKNSLHRCHSDTSYSSMETDFLMSITRHVSGSSAQNLELNVMDISGSFRLDLSQQQQKTNCDPAVPERAADHEDSLLVSDSQKIASETANSNIEPATVSPCREETLCVSGDLPIQCPPTVSNLQKQDNEDRFLQDADKSFKNLDRVQFSKQRADSLESLTFSRNSMEAKSRQDSNLADVQNGCNSKLPGFPKSWSTPSAVSFLDKSTLRVESRSLDQSELNDNAAKSAENGLSLQSGSSTESGPVMASVGDSIERAREILGHSSDICSSTPVKEPSPKSGARAQDGTNKTAGDVSLNGTSSKIGKGSSEKKKRGLSWYSRQKKLVLSPTYKSRSDDFKRIFKDIPSSERLIVDYSCALQKDILVQGRLYISQSWICFYANIFRWETMLTIRCKDIVKMTKERTARVIPNAIQILTKDEKYFFTSFGARDKTYLMLDRVWRNGSADEPMSRREFWQWVHYSYGEELGLTSGDEDYIPLSAEEKINFQTRVQKEESKLQKLSQRGDSSAAADGAKESSVDYLTVVNGELQPSVEEIDSSIADNLSVTSVDDSIYAFSESQNLTEGTEDMHLIPGKSPAAGCADGVVVGDMSSGVEEGGDSTGDEDVVRCSGHDHFSIDVIDETLNIPVDALFEHCFTDSPLYRDFVKNKKTFDVVLSPWPEEADVNGVKVRNIAYTLSLGYSIGPKYSPSTERQIMYPESRPGHFYLIDTECINGGIPYGENFYIVNRFCISKVSSNKSHLRITSELRYRKSVWGFVRSFIDKNATAGLIESFNVMADLLRQESDRQGQATLVSGQTNAVGRRRFVRRRRPVDRSPAKIPLVDSQIQNTSKQSTPVKHFTPKASTAKVKEDWHVKLTVDILVRIVCFVLILLMVFNAILFYKLWSLEATAANVLLSQKPKRFNFPDPKESRPESNDQWASLLKKQRVLHDSEIDHWKEILSTSIQLMDEMIHALTDLRSNIYERSIHADDEQGTEVPTDT